MTRTAKPSSKISVRDLASELGVSNATVSRALNDHPEVARATRAKVLEAAVSRGYRPRRRPQLANTIGLVYPMDPVRPDQGSFESAMLSGILTGVNEQRFDVCWINIERDKRRDESFVEFFERKGVRGVIVRSIVPGSHLGEEIAAEGVPCVLIADHSERDGVAYVYSDSRADSARVIDHLVHLGHTRIALAEHVVLDGDHQDRRDGYLDGLRRPGMDPIPELMIGSPGTLEGGRRAIERLLRLPDPPTAVYLTTPPATLGALQRCLELGIRVPQDLSIIGFDDSDTRIHAYPHYTAVCQDAQQMGLEAARWLTRSLAGVTVEPLRSRRPTSFVVQDSTAVAPVESVRLTPAGIARVEIGMRR